MRKAQVEGSLTSPSDPRANEYPFLKVEEKNIFDYEIKAPEKTSVESLKKGISGSSISRKESAKNSTAKYR